MEWLVKAKEGGFKGIQQAALFYEKSFQDPGYKKITVLELLKILKSQDTEVRENSAMMLLKLIDCHPSTLLENITILNDCLQDENKKIVQTLAKIIEFLAYKDPEKISSTIPNVINLLDSSDSQLRFTGLLIFKALSRKYDKFITIPKLVKLLDDENEKTRLNAIDALIELTDAYIDKVMIILYRFILNPYYQPAVSEMIFKISSKFPEKSVKSLSIYLKHKNSVIRRFTLIFLNNLAGKYLDSLTIAIPQLVAVLSDKIKDHQILASNLLLKISSDHAEFFKDNLLELLQMFKKLKGQIQLNLAGILIDISRYYPDQVNNLPEIIKKLDKFVKSSNNKISILARQFRSIIYKWNEDYATAIKICQDFIKKYPLEDNFNFYSTIAQIYHHNGEYKNAIRYFLDAIKSPDPFVRLNSLIMITYDQTLQNSFMDASQSLKKVIQDYEKLVILLPIKRKQKIDLMISYVTALIQLDFIKADEFLSKISNLYNYMHKWEQQAQKMEFQKLSNLKEHFRKLTQNSDKK